MPAENTGVWSSTLLQRLIRARRQLLEKEDPYTILVDTPELSAKQILDAAKRGDRLALDAVGGSGKRAGKRARQP